MKIVKLIFALTLANIMHHTQALAPINLSAEKTTIEKYITDAQTLLSPQNNLEVRKRYFKGLIEHLQTKPLKDYGCPGFDDQIKKQTLQKMDETAFAISTLALENIPNILDQVQKCLEETTSSQDLQRLKQSILNKYKIDAECYRPAVIEENKERRDRSNSSAACVAAGFKKVYYGRPEDLAQMDPDIKRVLKAEGVKVLTLYTHQKQIILYRPEGEMQALQFAKDHILIDTIESRNQLFNDYLMGFLLGYPEKDIEYFYVRFGRMIAKEGEDPNAIEEKSRLQFFSNKKKALEWLKLPENSQINFLRQWLDEQLRKGTLRFSPLE